MMNKSLRLSCLMLTITCLFGAGGAALGQSDMSAYQTYLLSGKAPALREKYDGTFLVGTAISPMWLAVDGAPAVIKKHFGSLTCENQMKADFVMDRAATLQSGDETHVSLDFTAADKVLTFAMQNGMLVRAHTLVWHSQTPRWFFTQGFSDAPDAPFVDRETMLKRMENYIRDEMNYINTAYPGVVYAWDVVNEAIEPADGHEKGYRIKNNPYYQIIGEDFIRMAFTYARRYASPEQKLFYNDYNCYDRMKIGVLRMLLGELKSEGLLDGLGLQSHIGMDSPTLTEYENALYIYSTLDIDLHITELDVSTDDGTPQGQMALAVRYKTLFSLLKRLRERAKYNITSVTLWGLTDNQSWLSKPDSPRYPLLFDEAYRCKAAFFGALLDTSIPMKNTEDAIASALEKLGMSAQRAVPAGAAGADGVLQSYKKAGHHNPVALQHFGADPWALVYGDRVYLYMTADTPIHGADGTISKNTYGNIHTLRVLSSDDMVNWTDHGEIAAAGANGAAKWAVNSWAPCAAVRQIDGKDVFFLYFADSGRGIGVLQGDSPTGPFIDPIGRPLISRATPNCASVTWLFDPAVLTDDDGRAYLYFGGGIPEGKSEAPGTARAVELSRDMTGIIGTPVVIDAPYLFEDSGINKIGDTYYYSYCTNFSVPVAQEGHLGFGRGEIVYMQSKSPLGPFSFVGSVLKNPEFFFGVGGNNHHCMFAYRDKWYIAYHTQTLERDMGISRGYRNTFVSPLYVENDRFMPVSASYSGVQQVKAFDPYARTQTETMANMAGITTKQEDEGVVIMPVRSGAFVMVEGVEFGEEGAKSLTLRYRAGEDARVELHLSTTASAPIAALTLPACTAWRTLTLPLDTPLVRCHHLYFVFRTETVELDWWQFSK